MGYLGVLDLLAVMAVCLTAVVCFVIRSGWVTSLEEIHDEMDNVLGVPEALKNLREIVIANGLVAERTKLDVERLKADKTRAALGGK
jgi:hypothetical protein